MLTALLPKLWNSNNSVPIDVADATVAITNSRRRHVLTILDDADRPHDVGELAEAIAAIEQNKTTCELDAQDRKRVYIALIQVHLDTLNEIGAIAYNERDKHVGTTDATAGLAALIRHLESVCVTDDRAPAES